MLVLIQCCDFSVFIDVKKKILEFLQEINNCLDSRISKCSVLVWLNYYQFISHLPQVRGKCAFYSTALI